MECKDPSLVLPHFVLYVQVNPNIKEDQINS